MSENQIVQQNLSPQSQLNPKGGSCIKLFWGSVGIYVCFLISAILNEKILKSKYKPFDGRHKQAQFTYPIIFLLVPNLVGFLIGKSSNSFYKSTVQIPKYNLLKISITVLVSGLSFNASILYLDFPIVILIKSCNILTVIMVGVFCSKVKDNTSLKLGKEKLIVGVVLSIGILIFYSGNKNSIANNKQSVIGFALLGISVIADGFLPDFQAQVKQKFSPDPLILYEKTNLWVFIISLGYAICTKQIFEIFRFMQIYPSLVLDVVSQSLMACIGQLFVYFLIFNFQQHVAPFVLTTRKIVSAMISIIVFNHHVSGFQCLGIVFMIIGICLEISLQKLIHMFKEWKKYKNYDVI